MIQKVQEQSRSAKYGSWTELLMHLLDADADYVCDVQRARHVRGGPAYLVLVFLGHGTVTNVSFLQSVVA